MYLKLDSHFTRVQYSTWYWYQQQIYRALNLGPWPYQSCDWPGNQVGYDVGPTYQGTSTGTGTWYWQALRPVLMLVPHSYLSTASILFSFLPGTVGCTW